MSSKKNSTLISPTTSLAHRRSDLRYVVNLKRFLDLLIFQEIATVSENYLLSGIVEEDALFSENQEL